MRSLSERERGTMAVEFALLVPAVVALIMFVTAGGRTVTAKARVEGAARDAARAATLSRGDADADGKAAAQQTLNSVKLKCVSGPTVTITVPEDGSPVTAVVSCDVPLSDLGLPGLPGSTSVTASVRAPVDTYRER